MGRLICVIAGYTFHMVLYLMLNKFVFQKAGVKVFILLYKELEMALTINSHYSKHALMNKCLENIKVCNLPYIPLLSGQTGLRVVAHI